MFLIRNTGKNKLISLKFMAGSLFKYITIGIYNNTVFYLFILKTCCSVFNLTLLGLGGGLKLPAVLKCCVLLKN